MKKLISTLIIILSLFFISSLNHLHAADVSTPCDELAINTSISVGDIVTCSIEVVGDLDIFSFSGTAGETFRLTFTDVGGGNTSMIAEIFDPSAQSIGTMAIFNAGTFLDITFPSSGIYTVIVNEDGNNSTDSYIIALQSLFPSPIETIELCVDCEEQQSIDVVTDSDVFSFAGTAGNTIRLTFTDTGGGNTSVNAEVYDPDDQLVTTLATFNAGTFEDLVLSETGAYTIIVSEIGNNATDSYTLALQQLFPAPPSAVVLCLTCSANGQTIAPIADSDLYLFTASSGDTIRVTFADIGGGNTSMKAEIFDPNDTLLTTLDIFNAGTFENLSIVTSGLYTILVTEIGNNSTDTYNLSLNCLFGGCLEPDIAADPINFDILNVPFNSVSPPQLVTVTNNGSQDLTVSMIMSSLAIYGIQNDNCTTGPIAAGGTCDFEVVCTPLWTGTFNTTISILSNDPDTPSLDLTSSCQGIGTPIPGSGVLGARTLGINGTAAYCANRTTGQIVQAVNLGSNTWDCGAAPLIVNPGDRVEMRIFGTGN